MRTLNHVRALLLVVVTAAAAPLAGCSSGGSSPGVLIGTPAAAAVSAASTTGDPTRPASEAELRDVDELTARCSTFLGTAVAQEGAGNKLWNGERSAEDYVELYLGAGAPWLRTMIRSEMRTERSALHDNTRYPGEVPEDVLNAYLKQRAYRHDHLCDAWVTLDVTTRRSRDSLAAKAASPVAPSPSEPADTPTPSQSAVTVTEPAPTGPGAACKSSFARMVDGFIHTDFTRETALTFTKDRSGRAAIAATLDELNRLSRTGLSNADMSAKAADSAGPFCDKHPNVVLDVPAPVPLAAPADALSCGQASGLSVYVGPKTSCAFGKEVAAVLDGAGAGDGALSVRSPVTKKTYQVTCLSGPTGFRCTVAGSVSTVWLS